MGDKANAHPGAAGRATAADHPASVRNVVLVGHSGSGKTTLVEALALTAGAVNRAGRVEDGGTVSDYDEIEHRQQRSVQLSLVPVDWDGYKINLLDTPGYADFVGELRAGLRAADAALFVVSASDGVDGSTRMVWEECAAVGMPRAIVVTHLESARADFEEMTRICAEAFGADDPDAVLPLYLPLHGAPGAGRARARDRADRAAVAEAVRLLLRGAQGVRAGPGPAAADRGGPQPAHRGDHRGERGRDPHGPLSGRRGDRRQDAGRGPGAGRRARGLLPGAGRRSRRRGRPAGPRHGRAAGAGHRRLPDPAGARGARGHHGRRQARAS